MTDSSYILTVDNMDHKDQSLIDRYLLGDVGAFEELYEEHSQALLGFIISLNAPYDVAEDIAQESWLRGLNHLKNYRGDAKFRPWLFKIAYHCYLDFRKSAWEKKRKPIMESNENTSEQFEENVIFIDQSESPREQAISSQLLDRVENALRSLPQKLRDVLLLRIDGEMTYREISETLNCPLGTVLWRAKEGQKQLAKLLEINPEEIK